MKILIIKKHPDYRWLPGTEVECLQWFGNKLIKDKCAVEGYASYEEYLRYMEKQERILEKQAKKEASKHRK